MPQLFPHRRRHRALSPGNGLRFAALVATLAAAGAGALPGLARAFAVGDLYLLSTWLPDVAVGILRIDPLTGVTSVLVDIDTNVGKTLTYDPYRDRLMFIDASAHVILAADDTGTLTPFLPGQHMPGLLAARGDGIVYLWDPALPGFLYADRLDVVHDLRDADGAARFTFPFGTHLNELVYDPSTNSLVCFQGTFDGVTIAGCGDPNAPCAVKIPLTPDGTQVAGATSTAQADVSPSSETVVGAGVAPGGLVFVVDTNSNDGEPRMLSLQTQSMTTAFYASNGPYIGAASTNAGTYSNVRGQALILDTTFDVLRAYSPGGQGFGTAFAAGVSSTGGGEFARLVEIGAAPLVAAEPHSGGRPLLFAPTVAPNPFSSAAVLQFELAAPSWLSVGVYDLQGRRVRQLAAAMFGTGAHSMRWDGRDGHGSSVAAGVYLVQFQGQEGVATGKVILQR